MNYDDVGTYLEYDVLITEDNNTSTPIDLDTLQDIVVLIEHEKTRKPLAKFSKIEREGYTLGTIDDPASGVMKIVMPETVTKNAAPGPYSIYVKYWDSDGKSVESRGILEELIDSPLKNVELPS